MTMMLSSGQPVDAYFYNAGLVSEQLPYDARVRYRYFARKPGLFFGTPFIRSLIDRTCDECTERQRPVIRSLSEGKAFGANQIVMEIEWEFSKLVGFETAILGILSHCGTAYEMSEIVKAAKGRPVYTPSKRGTFRRRWRS